MFDQEIEIVERCKGVHGFPGFWYIRENSSLVHALARFALQIQTNRRNWFRQLSTEANKKTLAAKLAVVQHAFDSVWI